MASDETPRFAADRMLMRLARWLRLAGADVIADDSIDGAGLLRRARIENRILLTRDKRLRTASDVFFVESNDLREQLRGVLGHFAIDPTAHAFTRCSRCNAVLAPVERELVSRRVPPYVFASHDRFAECLSCGRIYWPETHQNRIAVILESMKPLSHGGTK
ncbi:MAG: Mut7-C RNAse domain-containing protein [Candidatus Binatus sp.]|uniref:Mut7-C RNAse domain-containing protein n=1 Tax=Candidatus Binatus sp. TaxID=2811406 RepID=UPI00271D4617|nr:Mut7-C RNAse domain-containing protein [Candidatus Binatus sp.]MDO8433476.1 Mut7-C RNAse domain-containing protein [Candidatus Binatus sp.]